jgi:hypothetical protein
MAKMPKEVMDMLNNPQSAKVLATCDSAAKLNAVPKGSLTAVDDETVAFADIFGDKTNVNLKATNKAAVTFFSTDLPPVGYQVKAYHRPATCRKIGSIAGSPTNCPTGCPAESSAAPG